MTGGAVASAWKLLDRPERISVARLLVVLSVGLGLELLSFGALIPAISIVSDGLDEGRMPFLNAWLGGMGEEEIVVVVVVALSLLFTLKSAYVIWSIWLQRDFSRRVERRLTLRMVRHYMHQPFVFHIDQNTATLVRNVGAPAQFTALSVDSLLTLGTDGAVLVGLLSLLLVIEPLATTVVVVVLGSCAAAFFLLTRKRIGRWGERRMILEGRKLQVLQEGFSAIKEIKATESEEAFTSQFAGHLSESTRISRNYVTLSTVPRVWLELLAFIGLGVLLVVLTIGGRSLQETLPQLAVFAAAAFRLMPAINRIVFAFQNLRFGRFATDLLAQVLAEPEPTHAERPRRTTVGSGIEFTDVSFRYPMASRDVLRGVSLSVEPGSIVGIIGESGSGKSTLVSLLLGLLRPGSGRIRIGDVDIVGPLGRAMGYVPQSVYLIDESIRKNVAFGVPEHGIDDAKVLHALQQARIDQFVLSRPDGLGFNVGENGSRLSGGQRQRIGIARALYFDADTIVFDEVTSALDAATAIEVLAEIRSMRGSKTLILVSHDDRVLAICDAVYEVADGSVAQRA